MGKIVKIHLGEHRSVDSYDLNDVECRRDDYVILEVDRGAEFGRIISDDQGGCKTGGVRIDATDIPAAGNNLAAIMNEVGINNIVVIKTVSGAIQWGEVTGLLTTSGAVKMTSDPINWNDISAIKTKTGVVPWSDVTGIKIKTLGRVIRRVTDGDMNQIRNNRLKARDAVSACVRKIDERKLDMRIVQSEYTFDCSKIIFFFTSDGRVDFRNLVKDLAKVFRVRIELRQIGVRDKAKMIGGYGVCGRELCCSSYMHTFHNLSIKMAKDQSLPLNPSRISGVCGRIKCCMAYEFEVYREMARDLPHVGDKVTVPEGKGKIREVNILRRTALVDLGEGKVTRMTFPPQNDG